MSKVISEFPPYEYTTDEMLCPECNTMLVKGSLKQYENLCDHVSNPNDDNLPLRVTYVCPNEECVLHKTNDFWDKMGDSYGTDFDWYYENRIDENDKSTWKRKGSEAIGSFSHESMKRSIKHNRKLKTKIKKWLDRKIFNPLHSKGMDLCRGHNPEYADYRDFKQSTFKFMLGQCLRNLNPFDISYKRYMGKSKKYPFGRENFSVLRDNWSYHPYFWIRIPVRRFLKKKNEWFTDLEENRKTRWA